jgi:hypothetical protein
MLLKKQNFCEALGVLFYYDSRWHESANACLRLLETSLVLKSENTHLIWALKIVFLRT